jgi:hypothetical protein
MALSGEVLFEHEPGSLGSRRIGIKSGGDRFLGGVITNHKRNWPIERHTVFLTHSSDNRKRHMRVMVSDSPLLG